MKVRQHKFILNGIAYLDVLERDLNKFVLEAKSNGFDIKGKSISTGAKFVVVMIEYDVKAPDVKKEPVVIKPEIKDPVKPNVIKPEDDPASIDESELIESSN